MEQFSSNLDLQIVSYLPNRGPGLGCSGCSVFVHVKENVEFQKAVVDWRRHTYHHEILLGSLASFAHQWFKSFVPPCWYEEMSNPQRWIDLHAIPNPINALSSD
jgi:hypothetical protein